MLKTIIFVFGLLFFSSAHASPSMRAILFYAAETGAVEVVRDIVDYKDKITLTAKDFQDAQKLAKKNGHEEVAKVLKVFTLAK